ncbi:FMN-dependent NADH-azoreductase [Paracoccus aminophilus]|uniref:FMN dependent NADH:quinone oxidoreductase n=1 Tax=Paracoccus aminophilus JCM 7686 TaxID=1367847 RepID=S5Y6M1_PARAH|nr:FMN-dependent NADH-azoreductase [Paracoccus aminophilus]AGT11250.1 FMN-dependent NADH-azoreductase [Paracoccus aminophilus JCM 7686]
MNILHIDTSITGPASISRLLTAEIVETERQQNPGATVVLRDLAALPISHLGTDTGGQPDLGETVLEEFLAADIVVIGAPMYNFTIPSQLKAWIDRIAVAGKTFRYTETGPEGLATGKKVIIASTRGGLYSAGAAGAALDHQETYLRAIFSFIGINDVIIVRAEGIALGEDTKANAISSARETIAQLAA